MDTKSRTEVKKVASVSLTEDDISDILREWFRNQLPIQGDVVVNFNERSCGGIRGCNISVMTHEVDYEPKEV